jgi:DNA invertase Pin-like site-specific DNA recombinase
MQTALSKTERILPVSSPATRCGWRTAFKWTATSFIFQKSYFQKCMRYGYARVSSNTQDYAAQVDVLKAGGCARIFSEKASGKSTNGRPELARLMKVLQPGDAVVVTKLDRIARSSRDLHNIIGELQERGCGFVSLGDTWCDTTSDVGRLVRAIMGGIAEFERSPDPQPVSGWYRASKGEGYEIRSSSCA